MKPIAEAWCIQIDVTTRCGRNCPYCSRWSRHIGPDRQADMTMDQIRHAIQCTEGHPARKLGIIGGEPMLHPQFADICGVAAEARAKGWWVGLWTSIHPARSRFEKDIEAGFDWVALHDHSDPTELHQKATVASFDAVPDKDVRDYLIDHCWVQRDWCPTITANGAYFCEVAYGIDHIAGGSLAWPVEPGWWNRRPPYDQRSCCQLCGMPVPMERQPVSDRLEDMSPSVVHFLATHKAPIGLVRQFRGQLTADQIKENARHWTPGAYKPGTTPGGVEL